MPVQVKTKPKPIAAAVAERGRGSRRSAPIKAAGAAAAAGDFGDIGPLGRMVGYALRRAQLAVFENFIRELGEINLRPAQFSVLLLLEMKPGVSQSAVAAALGIQRANFVALFDQLEARGLAERRPAPRDRRSHALFLTGPGQTTLERAKVLAAGHEARQLAKLGPGGIDRLLGMLGRLSEGPR